jgi:transcriptional regulator with XRE-family HTH domain
MPPVLCRGHLRKERTMTMKQRKAIMRRFGVIRGSRSYQQFAKDSGITLSLLQRYETGAGMPSAENLIALRSREGVNVSWLLLGEGSMKA